MNAGRTHALLATAFLLPLGACSASQCDPTQADLFTGVGCAVSGYQQRNADQQAALNAANTENGEAEIANQNAQQNEGAAEAELGQRRAQLYQLERQTASLRERVRAAQANQRVSSGALQQLNDQIAILRRLQAANANAPTSAQLAAIRARQAQLANILTQMGQ